MKNRKKMENLRYVIDSSLYIAILLSFRSLWYNLSTSILIKINPVEGGYFWGKSLYLNEKSQKMENLRYIVVSSLYIAILLLLRTLRYYLSTKNVYQNQPRGKWLFLG